ncbi:MAG: uroporphyrinogen decarboxylase family protein [Clostridia bacterium]
MRELTERENMLLMLEGRQPEWIPNFSAAAMNIEPACLARKLNPATGYLVDFCGVDFTSTIDGYTPAHTNDGNFAFKDITKWKEYMPKVDLDRVDWEQDARSALFNARSLYGEMSEGEKVINYTTSKLWEEMHYGFGFEEALCALAEEPEACYDFLQAMADYQIKAFHKFCKYCKPDLGMLFDHMATATGMMMSPKTYREIIKPAQKKVCDALIEEGVMPEIHVDGDISAILPDLAEIGIKAIQPFQIFNDIEGAKERYGMNCIGGWDSFGPGNQPDADEAAARQSVRDAMDQYGPTNRYAIFLSGVTKRNPDRMFWLNDEANRYGRAFYHNR